MVVLTVQEEEIHRITVVPYTPEELTILILHIQEELMTGAQQVALMIQEILQEEELIKLIQAKAEPTHLATVSPEHIVDLPITKIILVDVLNNPVYPHHQQEDTAVHRLPLMALVQVQVPAPAIVGLQEVIAAILVHPIIVVGTNPVDHTVVEVVVVAAAALLIVEAVVPHIVVEAVVPQAAVAVLPVPHQVAADNKLKVLSVIIKSIFQSNKDIIDLTLH